MKRLLIVLIVLALILCLAHYGSKNAESAAEPSPVHLVIPNT